MSARTAARAWALPVCPRAARRLRQWIGVALVPRTAGLLATVLLTSMLTMMLTMMLATLATTAHASSPMAGDRGNYRGECRRLTKQIERYEKQVLPLAHARGNRSWARATEQQIDRLWHRRADLCPAYGKERTLLRRLADQTRRFNRFVANAGRAAAAFFSGGATGF